MRKGSFFSIATAACALIATLALAASAQAVQAPGPVAPIFAVISDPHFYDASLGVTGSAFEDYLAQDRKMIRESEAILASSVTTIKAKKPDFVIVSGDLTKDGELTSHQKFAGYLARLEAAGIKVYVCPGNHDVNNPHAYSYSGDAKTPTATVSPAEFESIYANFGYGEAVYRDPASLSYIAEPVNGLWLFSIDSCKYEDNLTTGHPETSGAIRPETLTWVLEKLAEARSSGKSVIAFMHHGVTEHYTGQSTAFADYVIDDWSDVSAKLAYAGLRLVFTGHYHANDITETTPGVGRPTLFDVETGSLVTYPSPIRMVSLHNDQASIHTEYVSKISYNTGGKTFPDYAGDYLYEGLYGIAVDALMYDYGLPEAYAWYYAPYIADAFMAHYAGDESPTSDTWAFIGSLLYSGDATMEFLGQSLGSLWTDLAPADAFGLLDFSAPLSLSVAGAYTAGAFDEGAAEIVAYDPDAMRLFVVNGSTASIDVLDAASPENPVKLFSISVLPYGAGVNSVAVKNGVVAAAVEAFTKQDPGRALFFNANATGPENVQVLANVQVGALPDMVIFTPDGNKVLVANEGEPSADYTNDPEGSVSVIDISGGVAGATVANVGFAAFNTGSDALKAAGVRLFGPGSSVAQDMEPEYIAVSSDSKTAWVTCQENNAVAVLDIDNGAVTNIFPLGYKDHSVAKNGLDASDKDGNTNIATYSNLFGMYMPDAVSAFEVGGKTYLLTANEGDSREYDNFSEVRRVKNLALDAAAFPNAAALKKDAVLGRLNVTTTLGDTDGDGDYDELYAFGARSFSIFMPADDGLDLVFDSADAIEHITAAMLPGAFNSNNDENASFDARSDDKGPEPEAATVGVIDGHTYAFIGLERIGGIMVYEVTDPENPAFVQYFNNRNFTVGAEDASAGDLGPEGLEFIPSAESPTGENLLAAANEISGTTTLYTISVAKTPISGDLDGDGDVDSDDIALITFHRNQPAAVYPAADLNGDGLITVLDARKAALLYTR
jgi:DNA-binding beta-propeller fold protein YncE